jgi:hypothetical protein
MKPKDLKLKDLDVGDLKAAARIAQQARKVEQPFSARVRRRVPKKPKVKSKVLDTRFIPWSSTPPPGETRDPIRRSGRLSTKPLRRLIKIIRLRYAEAAKDLRIDLHDRSPRKWAATRRLAHGARRNTENLWLAEDALDDLVTLADWIDKALARYRAMSPKEKEHHKKSITHLHALGLPLTLPLGVVELLDGIMTTMQAFAPLLANETKNINTAGRLIGSAFRASAVGVKRVGKRRDRKRTPA